MSTSTDDSRPPGRRVAAIRSIRSFLPDAELSNEQLAEEFGDWDASKILDKTGIQVRHLAAPGECASDLGVRAAERLFASGACRPTDVDFLLFCTQSPDYFLPTTACLMQDRLGLRTDCGAFDFNQGCSGFVYGLSVAKGLVETGAANNVLLITAETYSRFLNATDRSVRTIFGDAASATLIAATDCDDSDPIGPFVFGTDGRGAKNLIVEHGGARHPFREPAQTEDKPSAVPPQLFMNGPEVFAFTLSAVPAAVNGLLERWHQPIDAVDYFVFHQANKFMLERLRNKLAIPSDKFWLDMRDTGNTVSSTIPIALEKAGAQGLVRSGEQIMLVGFGVGYSWAASMVKVCWL